MEKYLIHSSELNMVAGSTHYFDLYKVVETYFKDLEARRKINNLLGIVNTEEDMEEKLEGFQPLLEYFPL